MLNAKNGTKIADLTTNNASTATPSGLAYISAWVITPTPTTRWKRSTAAISPAILALRPVGPTTASWAVQLVPKLVDGSGNAQPVTTEPDWRVSGYRMIYVGTGSIWGAVDIPLATGALPAPPAPRRCMR